MDFLFNVVFLFRALRGVIGWKPSVLMVTNITTTQRLEVENVIVAKFLLL